jgi:hypothetical protein
MRQARRRAYGSCRSRGRTERAHRSLHNHRTVLHKLPHAFLLYSPLRRTKDQNPRIIDQRPTDSAEEAIRERRPAGTPAPVRPRPRRNRVWASLVTEPAAVIADACLDASSRDPTRPKRWVGLVDGNADPLARVQAAATRHRVPITIVLDLIPVLESLWNAADVFPPAGSREAEAWVSERLLWLLCGDVGQGMFSNRL